MSFYFIDNTPQKHDSIDIKVLNEMIKCNRDDGTLAINSEYSIDKNNIQIVYPKEKHPDHIEKVPMVIETNIYSNNLTGYVSDASKPSEQSNNDEPKRTLKMDGITNFYIGSLTIVGLYLVYRLIQKSR